MEPLADPHPPLRAPPWLPVLPVALVLEAPAPDVDFAEDELEPAVPEVDPSEPPVPVLVPEPELEAAVEPVLDEPVDVDDAVDVDVEVAPAAK